MVEEVARKMAAVAVAMIVAMVGVIVGAMVGAMVGVTESWLKIAEEVVVSTKRMTPVEEGSEGGGMMDGAVKRKAVEEVVEKRATSFSEMVKVEAEAMGRMLEATVVD
jgi:hypothetical protein